MTAPLEAQPHAGKRLTQRIDHAHLRHLFVALGRGLGFARGREIEQDDLGVAGVFEARDQKHPLPIGAPFPDAPIRKGDAHSGARHQLPVLIDQTHPDEGRAPRLFARLGRHR